ncbi:DUF892 family protein [Mucilaginibacter polytrichastri]|uniref:Uncharacterized protein n=1 Tax=Mucilaginibacter polytrichastri TaxID=1302689 RepID=A0A1Q6A280_9SPHI|nr:DUF892 family protein [Mucilaginibacter polytrichastri]OKS88124.1 hypothetical protein RG47T_3588 [Mucilaginibacter polytrichastri]SFT09466.1 Ferritin-like metal-binding protein YciE [Mucilaginibacter polytrichastri]
MKNKLYYDKTINKLVPEKVRTFFVVHLNHIYTAKSHFVERLPEIGLQGYFEDLKKPIEKLTEDVTLQLSSLNAIFKLLDAEPTVNNSGSLICVVENAFSSIPFFGDSPSLRDMSLRYYLYNIANMETASFKILQTAASELKNKPISLLLTLNFKDAKIDRTKTLFGA